MICPSCGSPSVDTRPGAEAPPDRGALRFLLDTSRVIAASLDYEQTLQAVADAVVPKLADRAAVWIVESDGTLRQRAVNGAPAALESSTLTTQVPLQASGDHPLARAVRSGQASLHQQIPDVWLDGERPNGDGVTAQQPAHPGFALIVPLTARGRALGVLTCDTAMSGRTLDPADLELADEVGHCAALAIDNARQYHDTRDALQRQAALLRASHRLADVNGPGPILLGLLVEAIELVGASTGAVFRWDSEQEALVRVWNAGHDPVRVESLRLGQGASGRAAQRRSVAVFNDYQRECTDEAPNAPSGIRAAMAAPLLHEGQLLGTLSVVSSDPDKQFSAEDAELLGLLAAIAAAELVGVARAQL